MNFDINYHTLIELSLLMYAKYKEKQAVFLATQKKKKMKKLNFLSNITLM